MPATATVTNFRIAPMYYDTPPRTLPDLPKTPAERRQVMADAMFASVLALQGLLTDKDPKVVIQAAGMILDLDKTQMRHSSHICGTHNPTPLDPLPGMPGHESPTKSANTTQLERPAPLLPTPEKMAQMSRMIDEDDFEENDDFDDDLFDAPEPKTANVADPMVAFVEKVRAGLQRIADREGTGEVVTWQKAEQTALRTPPPNGKSNSQSPAVGRGSPPFV